MEPWVAVLLVLAGMNLLFGLVVCFAFRTRDLAEVPEPVEVPPPLEPTLQPQRAAVRPRGFHPKTLGVFPLEEDLRPIVASGISGSIRLSGLPGSGKTTALEHLLATFSGDGFVRFLDEPPARIVSALSRNHLVIYTSQEVPDQNGSDLAAYQIAAWDRDDVIEYLLAVAPAACPAVMQRLDSKTELAYRGIPEIWKIILDTLLTDPALPSAQAALSSYLQWLEPDLRAFKAAGCRYLDHMAADSPKERPNLPTPKTEFGRLLRHREIQRLVAAEQLVDDLQSPRPPNFKYLSRIFPKALIDEAAALIAEDAAALAHLMSLLDRPLAHHSLIVSLLHAAEVDWPPEFCSKPVLPFAFLDRVNWPAVDLTDGILDMASFHNAELSLAKLDIVKAVNARFVGAKLIGASLQDADFPVADFSQANLSGVNAWASRFERAKFIGANLHKAKLPTAVLTQADMRNANLSDADLMGATLWIANLGNACLNGANLSKANLEEANLDGADLTGANLESASLPGLRLSSTTIDGANFQSANLQECDLENITCENVRFEKANLKYALLTNTCLQNANFSQACLRGAKLADICWEGANLQGADLRGVTFHMGSTRSGLLFTGIASEGTRTGFYTDEYEEQSFRAPEEIRKANLCGADLRGALLSGVDFYLVDLRGAIYDADQAQCFRRCGAIL